MGSDRCTRNCQSVAYDSVCLLLIGAALFALVVVERDPGVDTAAGVCHQLERWLAVQWWLGATAGAICCGLATAILAWQPRECASCVYAATTARSPAAVLCLCPMLTVLFEVVWLCLGLYWSVEHRNDCKPLSFAGYAHVGVVTAATLLLAVWACGCAPEAEAPAVSRVPSVSLPMPATSTMLAARLQYSEQDPLLRSREPLARFYTSDSESEVEQFV
eukprot:TRINITY_DN33210_c0_g1_i1.p1 TRINITY_DN33210_c0_g1~~TRINITY_DN33210_c0_g1_i1.p1  ORF type:complete len:240 (+),score=66.11 TRINITY_DN33210_c0_g1_i1:67-720(+)